GNSKPCGITPTIVHLLPFSSVSWPTAPWSPPNARFHRPSEITATWGAPFLSSSWLISLPASGKTPSDSSMPPVTNEAVTRIGVTEPVRFAPPLTQPSSVCQDWESRRKSKNSGGEIQNRRRLVPCEKAGNSE